MIRLANKLKKDGNAEKTSKPPFIMRDKLLSKGNIFIKKIKNEINFFFSLKIILTEIQEIQINLPSSCQLSFPNSNELHKIHLQIKPEERLVFRLILFHRKSKNNYFFIFQKFLASWNI